MVSNRLIASDVVVEAQVSSYWRTINEIYSKRAKSRAGRNTEAETIDNIIAYAEGFLETGFREEKEIFRYFIDTLKDGSWNPDKP